MFSSAGWKANDYVTLFVQLIGWSAILLRAEGFEREPFIRPHPPMEIPQTQVHLDGGLCVARLACRLIKFTIFIKFKCSLMGDSCQVWYTDTCVCTHTHSTLYQQCLLAMFILQTSKPFSFVCVCVFQWQQERDRDKKRNVHLLVHLACSCVL